MQNDTSVSTPLIESSFVVPPSITDISSTVILAPLDADIHFLSIENLLTTGGPVIIVLGLMSVVAMSVLLLKCIQFIWLGVGRHQQLTPALLSWEANKPDSALQQLARLRTPIARVLEVAIQLKKRNNISDTLAREEVLRVAKGHLTRIKSHLHILEVIATLSPLLGLLGTVLGMIVAFQKLQSAGANVDPSVLSGGIWEALLTTAAGLIVAIPTVAALHWLEQKVEKFKLTMEDAMTQIFTASLFQEKKYTYQERLEETDNRENKPPTTSPVTGDKMQEKNVVTSPVKKSLLTAY